MRSDYASDFQHLTKTTPVSREASRDARVTPQSPFATQLYVFLGHLAAGAGLMKRKAACLTFLHIKGLNAAKKLALSSCTADVEAPTILLHFAFLRSLWRLRVRFVLGESPIYGFHWIHNTRITSEQSLYSRGRAAYRNSN